MENLVPLKTRQSKSELYNPQTSGRRQQQQQQPAFGGNFQNLDSDDWTSELNNYLEQTIGVFNDNVLNTTQAVATIEDLDCIDQLPPFTYETNLTTQDNLHHQDLDLIQILEDPVEDLHSRILEEANKMSTTDRETTPQPLPARPQLSTGKRLPLPPPPQHVSEDESDMEDDRGKHVTSPVRSRSKRRRSSSSSSSGSSSDASSHVSHSSKRSRTSNATSASARGHKGYKKSKSNKREKKRSPDRVRSSPPPRDRDRTSNTGGGSIKDGDLPASRKASRDKTQMPPPPPSTIVTSARNTFTDAVPPPPPPSVDMDSMYREIQQKKARALSVAGLCGQDSDAASSHCNTLKSTRVRRPSSVAAASSSKGPMTVDDVLLAMDEDIRNTDIARATAEMVLAMNVGSTGNRRREIVDCVRLIKRYDLCRDPAEGSIRIDAKNYLFSAVKKTFGIDVNVVDANNVKSSLLYALSHISKTNTHEDRLDLVFRASLKDIAKSLSDEESPLISARYLELTLIKNIRDFYRKKYSHDIVRFFTCASADDKPKALTDIAAGSECEGYLRKLCDRYELTYSNFDQEFREPMDVTTMRVWTSRESQIHTTNVHVLNHLNEVTEAAARSNQDVAERKGVGLRAFCDAYKDANKSVFSTHKKLITELLHSSELMAWMCFGLVIDDETYGFRNMAGSHYNIYCKKPDFNEANKVICWNYPLASQYRFKKPKAYKIPEDDYLAFMEDSINETS